MTNELTLPAGKSIEIPVDHCQLHTPPFGTEIKIEAIWDGKKWIVTALSATFGREPVGQ